MKSFKLTKKEDTPLENITQDQLLQNRINMQSEIDKMNYAIQKSQKQKTLREMTGPGAKVRDVLGEVGRALDGFGDMGLKDNDNINDKPKFIKSIDSLATFKS